MKKLLTIAVVACVATFAQALTINWTASDTSASVGGEAFKLVYTTEATAPASISAVAEILKGGSLSGYDTVDGATTVAWDSTKGTISLPEGGAAATSGTYYVFYYDNANAYGASFNANGAPWFGVAGEAPEAATRSIELTFEQVAVPEPTALALLALGVAGVALRRRRRA